MGSDKQRQRYELLRERQQAHKLTPKETAGLALLTAELSERESATLVRANERKTAEIAALADAIERLEGENRRLHEYLNERQAFLERLKSTVAQIQAEDQAMRARFADERTNAQKAP